MRLDKAIFNVLKFCDFFGITFNFLINKQKSYTTTLGGVFSISMIIIIIACFGYYLSELTKYTKFTFYTQDLQVDHPPSIFGDNQNFSLAIEVKNYKGENILDDRLFSFSLYQVKSFIKEDQVTGLTETIFSNEIIPLSQCNKKNTSLCIDDKFNSTIILDGTSKDTQMSYLEFQMNICLGYTPTGQQCYNSTQIKSLLQDSQVKFYYTAYYMQLNETNFPKKSFTAMDSFFLDYGYTRHISYYLKNLLFYSDNDWFFQNFKLTTAYQLDGLRESIKFQDRSSTIFKIQILASNSVIKYYRQYTKILQVLVNMGGLINTLFVIGTFVVSYIGDIKMKVFIMNRLFEFVEDEEELSSYKRRSHAKIEELRLFLHTVGKINLEKRNSEKSKRSERRITNQTYQKINYNNKHYKNTNNLNIDFNQIKNYREQEEELDRTRKMSNFNNFNYFSLANFKKKSFNLGDGKIMEIHPEDGVSINYINNRKESLTEAKQNNLDLNIPNIQSPERNHVDIHMNTEKSDTPSSTRTLQPLKQSNNNYSKKKLSLEGIDVSLNRDSVLLRRNTDNNNNNPYNNLPLSTSMMRKSQDLSISIKQDKSKVEDINNLQLEKEQENDFNDENNEIEEHELQDIREISELHLPDESHVKEQNLCDDTKVNLDEIEKLISAEEKRNKKFTLTYSDLFCVAFCCCIARRSQHKKKYNRVRMYEKAEMEMAKTFDVVEMFKELQKLSGFISFFFNKKQLYLLNHLERPKIIFKNLQPDSHKKKVENLIKSFNSYIDLKNNLDNLINMKLLEKIDLNTKEVFNKMMNPV
jgi:hypothetical protein